MSSPIELVENLRTLVSSTYTSTTSDPLELHNSKRTISHLCLKLLQAVQGPEEYTATLSESCQESSALYVVTALNVADHIAASPKGQLSLKELSEKTNAQEQYLSVTLSTLSIHGYFTEVGGFGSRIYANNDFSDLLRSDSTTEGGRSMKEAIGLTADDGAKGTTRLLEAADRQNIGKTAGNIAFDMTGSYFEWASSPGNEWRGQRIGKAMIQFDSVAGIGVGEDLPWQDFKTPVVDLGGGVGSLERKILLVPKNKDLTFVIFDLQKTVEHAAKLWTSEASWVQDRVSFVGGDFTKSSPAENKIPTAATGAGTYVIRHALHNWTDLEVVNILKNVRAAMLDGATPLQPPKLVILEMVLREHSTRFVRATSLQLLSLTGGVTRTEMELRELFTQGGFIVENVQDVRGTDSAITLIPSLI